MAFNFPSSPAVGQVSNGYVWNGTAWVGNGNLAAAAPPADTAPANPANGQLWYESDTGILWLWYVDANTSQWVQIGGSGIADAPNDGKGYVRRNGVWVLAKETISAAGLTTISWTAPAWAKKMRFQGTLWHGSTASQFPGMQAGVGGTFFGAAGTYINHGFTHYSATNAFNLINASPQTVALFSSSGNSITVPVLIRGEVTLERPSTGAGFAFELSGTTYDSTNGAEHGTIYSYMATATTTALRITDLRIINSIATAYAAGSEINVEWF